MTYDTEFQEIRFWQYIVDILVYTDLKKIYLESKTRYMFFNTGKCNMAKSKTRHNIFRAIQYSEKRLLYLETTEMNMFLRFKEIFENNKQINK